MMVVKCDLPLERIPRDRLALVACFVCSRFFLFPLCCMLESSHSIFVFNLACKSTVARESANPISFLLVLFLSFFLDPCRFVATILLVSRRFVDSSIPVGPSCTHIHFLLLFQLAATQRANIANRNERCRFSLWN